LSVRPQSFLHKFIYFGVNSRRAPDKNKGCPVKGNLFTILNFLLLFDVSTIREVLGLPVGHIRVEEDDPLCKEVAPFVKPGASRPVVERNLAGHWLPIHREAAKGRAITQKTEELLSPALWQSAVASAQVDLGAKGVPDWLRRPPNRPAPYSDAAFAASATIASPNITTSYTLSERPTFQRKLRVAAMFGEDRAVACRSQELPQKLGNVLRSVRGI